MELKNSRMAENGLITLPEKWVWTKIDNIGIVVSGGTPSTKEPEFWGDEIPWITPSDLSGYQDTYISKGKRGLTKLGLEYSSATIIPENSVLFSSRAPIGYVAIAKNYLSTNQGFKNLVLSDFINSKYVYYFFKTIKEYAESLASGTTFLELSAAKFRSIDFPLAPIDEQGRIVNKIDEIFSGIDRSVVEFDNTLNSIALQKKNIVNKALKGLLTLKWRINSVFSNDEYFDNLKKYSVKNEALPTEWLFLSLQHLTTKITDGTHHTPKYISDGIPFISVKDIKNDIIDFSNTKFISKEEHASLIKRCNPEAGDVLITKSGTIGRLAIVPKDVEFSLFVSVALIKIDHRIIDNRYLFYCLQNFINSINIAEDIKGAVQKNFHLEDIRNTRIPLCRLDEQRKIVEEIESQMHHLSTLENEIIKAKNATTMLYRKTLNDAFSGKLTLRSKDDTPVEISLNNIEKFKTLYLKNTHLNRRIKRSKRAEVNLEEIIRAKFQNQPFSYKELFEQTNIKRETLEQHFEKLERNKIIVSSLDEIDGIIKYSLI